MEELSLEQAMEYAETHEDESDEHYGYARKLIFD